MGCHRTQAQAEDQLTAIQLSEFGTRALPDNYRPANSPDVPEGRACGNCIYNENPIHLIHRFNLFIKNV